MKERPILFNAEMVRAVFDGRKSQTRRVIKPQPPKPIADAFVDDDGYIVWAPFPESNYRRGGKPCPYGAPGDRLWVRETWALGGDYANAKACQVPTSERSPEYIRYSAHQEKGPYTGRWRPSIHMPRWASRITLEVTGVRVERVQDITEVDAYAEGVDAGCNNCGNPQGTKGCGCNNRQPMPVDAFVYLWNSINEKRGFGWWENPWVWVVEFKPIPSPPKGDDDEKNDTCG
jgi:hypothetical protein